MQESRFRDFARNDKDGVIQSKYYKNENRSFVPQDDKMVSRSRDMP